MNYSLFRSIKYKKISLTFTSFDLEQDYDYLYLYNGNSTSATDLSGGGFTGTTIPGPFLSTAPDGSLTLKFYSDGVVPVAPLLSSSFLTRLWRFLNSFHVSNCS